MSGPVIRIDGNHDFQCSVTDYHQPGTGIAKLVNVRYDGTGFIVWDAATGHMISPLPAFQNLEVKVAMLLHMITGRPE